MSEKSQGSLCPTCQTNGFVSSGSSVDHGNPCSPAADTEVTHYYKCLNCQTTFWSSGFGSLYEEKGNAIYDWDYAQKKWKRLK
jgi:hypothetical protein